jgi:hypothetical protein
LGTQIVFFSRNGTVFIDSLLRQLDHISNKYTLDSYSDVEKKSIGKRHSQRVKSVLSATNNMRYADFDFCGFHIPKNFVTKIVRTHKKVNFPVFE